MEGGGSNDIAYPQEQFTVFQEISDDALEPVLQALQPPGGHVLTLLLHVAGAGAVGVHVHDLFMEELRQQSASLGSSLGDAALDWRRRQRREDGGGGGRAGHDRTGIQGGFFLPLSLSLIRPGLLPLIGLRHVVYVFPIFSRGFGRTSLPQFLPPVRERDSSSLSSPSLARTHTHERRK